MAGTRPPKPPSALDGYRRLERTRSTVGGASAVVGAGTVAPALDADAMPRATSLRRASRVRAAGALRLLSFVAVLALIVGTSVSLASADERTAAPRKESSTPEAVVERTAEPAKVESTPVVAREAAKPVAEAPVKAAAEPAPVVTTQVTAPQAALPLTGDVQVRWLMLGGALLVLVGMLVQVAGQPLPARAAARRTA